MISKNLRDGIDVFLAVSSLFLGICLSVLFISNPDFDQVPSLPKLALALTMGFGLGSCLFLATLPLADLFEKAIFTIKQFGGNNGSKSTDRTQP